MFLAATPYFQRRFASNDKLLRTFQPSILIVSSVGNLGSIIVLTKLQSRANYPKRITMSLVLTAVVFTLLALSTKVAVGISAGVYFGFLMLMVLGASLSSGLCQNGVFAYVAGFERREYTQGIMVGHGIAGILPPITQIVSVLSVPPKHHTDGAPNLPSTSAFIYFMTATAVSLTTLGAFLYLLSRASSKCRMQLIDQHNAMSDSAVLRKSIPLARLFKKLYWLASAVFITFAVAMFFPVFTGKVLSVRDPSTAPRLFKPEAFIPLAFFFWNLGDLTGRMILALPALRLFHRPQLILILSILRIGFIPLYYLCNIGGEGAAVNSDLFYLFIVQLLFGMTNGYIGSSCMMGFPEYVELEELEAAGGFMPMVLVGGLTFGSMLSFAVS